MLKLLIVILLITSSGFFHLVYAQTTTEKDSLGKKAEDLLKNYFFSLNYLDQCYNSPNFTEADIQSILEYYLEDSSILIFNDLLLKNEKAENQYLRAIDYLNIYGFKIGAKHHYFTLGLEHLGFQNRMNQEVSVVKISIDKNMKVTCYNKGFADSSETKVDVYIKFPILEKSPHLKWSSPKIFSIKKIIE